MDGGHIRVQAGLMKLVLSGHQRQNPAQAGQLQHLQNPWLPHSLSRVLNSPVKGDWRVQNQHPRLPVSFLTLHTNRLKPGSRGAQVLPGVGGGALHRSRACGFVLFSSLSLSGALGVCILLITHQAW